MLPAVEQLGLLRARALSSVELIEALIAHAGRVDPVINAIALERFDAAVEEARAADQRRAAGGDLPLLGLPFTAKESIEIADMAVTLGSKSVTPHTSKRDAVVVESLRRAGAIPLAKTNISEHGLYYDANNLVYGKTVNPYDNGRSAGGSSGGEGAAIAAAISPLGVGSDLGGSIRIPASFCGICGLKPSPGVVPLAGSYPPLSIPASTASLVIGPMARTVDDLRLALPHFATPDPARDPVARGLFALPAGPRRVAAYWEDGVGPVDPECRRAVELAASALADAGYQVEWRAPPAQKLVRRAFLETAETELTAVLAPLITATDVDVSPQMRALIDLMAARKAASVAEYVVEQMKRPVLQRQVAEWQQRYPLMLAPVASCPAFPSGAIEVEAGDQRISATDLSVHATYVNLLGLPATAVPAHRTASGLPVGVQVIGRRYAEVETLDAAAAIEQALGGWQPPAFN